MSPWAALPLEIVHHCSTTCAVYFNWKKFTRHHRTGTTMRRETNGWHVRSGVFLSYRYFGVHMTGGRGEEPCTRNRFMQMMQPQTGRREIREMYENENLQKEGFRITSRVSTGFFFLKTFLAHSRVGQCSCFNDPCSRWSLTCWRLPIRPSFSKITPSYAFIVTENPCQVIC